MGLLGKIIKRQSAEDAEDLDFEEELVDSLDMPDEESGSSTGILGKVLKWRGKGDSEDADEDEDEEPDEIEDTDEREDADETDSDEYPSNADAAGTAEEDPPVQVVRLEGIPDVHPVGDSNTNMTPGPGPGAAAGAGGSAGASAGQDPAADSSLEDGNNAAESPIAEVDDAEGDDTKEGDSKQGGASVPDLGISLEDIFGEEEEVDEALRDLADFVEDVAAKDLASDLQEFLEELEARQK
ncbi:MAG: hypothetical protein J4N33_00655 [Chloroflexi bacterium]|nr:hypothetical protein [Chloroflexota bacterium]